MDKKMEHETETGLGVLTILLLTILLPTKIIIRIM